jgi:poly(hydroxyalkanoate) depolymerase family esterase
MLHGCTQNPDDFARGTDMNALARSQGALVLYPAQSGQANPQRCWNWFKHTHQGRERGEPALVAALVREIIATHDVDPHRVYVAGLSAGGAMAAILGDAYPDLFAAVGVHSGLPAGAATDVQGAFAAMAGAPLPPRRVPRHGPTPPTIVFHGDADSTVNIVNASRVVEAAGLAEVRAERVESTVNGLSFTRRVHADGHGEVRAEQWTLHGAGHAWQGGRPAGSYTDPRGPDASAEMLRFFLQHPRRP